MPCRPATSPSSRRASGRCSPPGSPPAPRLGRLAPMTAPTRALRGRPLSFTDDPAAAGARACTYIEDGLLLVGAGRNLAVRSEEQKSELQTLMRISFALICLKQKKNKNKHY